MVPRKICLLVAVALAALLIFLLISVLLSGNVFDIHSGELLGRWSPAADRDDEMQIIRHQASQNEKQTRKVPENSRLHSIRELRSEYRVMLHKLKTLEEKVESKVIPQINAPFPPRQDAFTRKKRKWKTTVDSSSGSSRQQSEDLSIGSAETIFISIASFRDPECAPTIADIYLKAYNPKRVFIGVIEQNDPGDPSCMPVDFLRESCAGYPQNHSGWCPADNIKMRRVLPSEAKGPTFGRYIGALMYEGQKWFMQIDSHNRFLPGWDGLLIRNAMMLPNPQRGVLSHYPNLWANHSYGVVRDGLVTAMCDSVFSWLGYVRLKGILLPISSRPRMCPFAAAGFLFADAGLLKNVPFDPYLDFIFDGEEILYTVRMWTHGYDIFSPTESFLFHYYGRKEAKRVYDDSEKTKRSKKHILDEQFVSINRARYIMKITQENTTKPLLDWGNYFKEPGKGRGLQEIERYGLGKERTLDAYYRFAHIDPVYRITIGDKWCVYAKGNGD